MGYFVFETLDVFKAKDEGDAVIIGQGIGKISENDEITIVNPGVDGCKNVTAKVTNLRVNVDNAWTPTDSAEDCLVSIQVVNGMKYVLRRGSVAIIGEVTEKTIHDAYISALGNAYVIRADFDFTPRELEGLTIGDATELIRIFNMYHADKAKKETEEEKAENKKKLDKVYRTLCKKILTADSIYAVYSVDTGEPFLFSNTYKKDDGFACTAAHVRLIPVCDYEMLAPVYPAERFEIKLIENGPNKKGIYNFLGSSFYLNGAEGVEINGENISIAARVLVAPPDYTNMAPEKIPVSNPELVKWIHLAGQMGQPRTDDEKLIFMLYQSFIDKEIVKAKFLIPMKPDKPLTEDEKTGETTLGAGRKFVIATQAGKEERAAVRAYTDWKTLRNVYGDDWGAVIQTADDLIGGLDLAINVTPNLKAGLYVDDVTYFHMKEHFGK